MGKNNNFGLVFAALLVPFCMMLICFLEVTKEGSHYCENVPYYIFATSTSEEEKEARYCKLGEVKSNVWGRPAEGPTSTYCITEDDTVFINITYFKKYERKVCK